MTFASRLASSAFQITLSNAAARAVSLVTMPLLTHLLSPAAYGVATVATTVITLISAIALSGMDVSYIRDYQSNPPQAARRVEIFAWRYAVVAGVFAATAGAAMWLLVSDGLSLPPYLAGLLGALIVMTLISTMAQTRARLHGKYQRLSLSIMASSVSTALVGIGTAYWWRRNELPLILSMLGGSLATILILGIPPISELVKRSGLQSAERRRIFNIGAAATVTAPTYWLLSSSDRWFLSYFEDQTSVGIYSVGYSIAALGLIANAAVASAWLPETLKEFENNPVSAPTLLGKSAEQMVAVYAYLWLLVTAVGGELIRLLAAPSFSEAGEIVPYIAAAVLFHGVTQIAHVGFIITRRFGDTMRWWIVGGLVCLALNLVLVPLMGRLGAALSQAASTGIVAIGLVITAQSRYPLRLSWSRLSLLFFGVLLTAIFMLPAWATSPMMSLVLKLPVMLLIAVLVCGAFAPQVLRTVTRRPRKPAPGQEFW